MGGIQEMWQSQGGVGKKGIFGSCCLWRWCSGEKGMGGICLVPAQNIIPRDIPHHRMDISQHRTSFPELFPPQNGYFPPQNFIPSTQTGTRGGRGRSPLREGWVSISANLCFSLWGFPPPSPSHPNFHSGRGVCCLAGGPSVAASVAVPAATAGPARGRGPCPGLSPDLIPDHPLPQSPTLPPGQGNPGTALSLWHLCLTAEVVTVEHWFGFL